MPAVMELVMVYSALSWRSGVSLLGISFTSTCFYLYFQRVDLGYRNLAMAFWLTTFDFKSLILRLLSGAGKPVTQSGLKRGVTTLKDEAVYCYVSTSGVWNLVMSLWISYIQG